MLIPSSSCKLLVRFLRSYNFVVRLKNIVIFRPWCSCTVLFRASVDSSWWIVKCSTTTDRPRSFCVQASLHSRGVHHRTKKNTSLRFQEVTTWSACICKRSSKSIQMEVLVWSSPLGKWVEPSCDELLVLFPFVCSLFLFIALIESIVLYKLYGIKDFDHCSWSTSLRARLALKNLQLSLLWNFDGSCILFSNIGKSRSLKWHKIRDVSSLIAKFYGKH
jgi:hypothetical protein